MVAAWTKGPRDQANEKASPPAQESLVLPTTEDRQTRLRRVPSPTPWQQSLFEQLHISMPGRLHLVWFDSLGTLSQVLSDQNRNLLKLILETQSESLQELTERSGRATQESFADAEDDGAVRAGAV